MDVRGSLNAAGCRFAIVVSRFNDEITSGLLAGARAALEESEVADEDLDIVHVPGAFEIPSVALRLARTGTYDAVITLGCLIKGETMHFEYIAAAAAHGIMQVGLTTGVPVAFGVLTAATDEQAVARSAAGPENKGREAALAAIEMATLLRQIAPAANTQARSRRATRSDARRGRPSRAGGGA
jgi:6,7-dimethyl-8-ribityllumazine synthase